MSELVRIGSPEWDVLTERRAALIRKKNHEGLSDHEWAEYERLQMVSRASIEAAFPPGLQVVCECQQQPEGGEG